MRRTDLGYSMQLGSKNCLLHLNVEYLVRENVYVLKSGDDVTPQFDKIVPLVPDTVPEINIEPNHVSRSELRRAFLWTISVQDIVVTNGH